MRKTGKLLILVENNGTENHEIHNKVGPLNSSEHRSVAFNVNKNDSKKTFNPLITLPRVFRKVRNGGIHRNYAGSKMTDLIDLVNNVKSMITEERKVA